MAKSSNCSDGPKWLIDLHGIKNALTTRSNSRARIIDAIQRGEMLVLRSVSNELKALYPELWDEFNAIKPKKYLSASLDVLLLATQLQERHGSSLLGSIPSFAHFEAIASAKINKCILVSGENGFARCKDIVNKCKMPFESVVQISEV